MPSQRQYDLAPEFVSLVMYLLTNTLDGRNSSIANGVDQALVRPPRQFTTHARETATTGVWDEVAHARTH